MLLELSIKNVVLIEDLFLRFDKGLNVFTGETGAGKSILLDSISLALGSRGNINLIGPYSKRLEVVAIFDINSDHIIHKYLSDNDYSFEGSSLILRRVLRKDGKSSAYINDNQVSISFLKKVGETLVEILGQFESHGLINERTHIHFLDKFMEVHNSDNNLLSCANAWSNWSECLKKLKQSQKEISKIEDERDFLTKSINKIESLSPSVGDEEKLVKKRSFLRNKEKIISTIDTARKVLMQDSNFESNIQNIYNQFNILSKTMNGTFDEICNSLDRTLIEYEEFKSLIHKVSNDIDLDPRELQDAEERLFALKSEARKHNVSVDDLSGFLDKLRRKLESIEDRGNELESLEANEKKFRSIYIDEAKKLRNYRKLSAVKLEELIIKELKPLKLNETRFRVKINELMENEWSSTGKDRVLFEVSTNDGMPFGLLSKISSGGELSRFLLSLKLILVDSIPAVTMIFDEVDSGIGGSTARAVGERLLRLSNNIQILVVTHSPQVAAVGANHWHVFKIKKNNIQATSAKNLSDTDREEEIARMLSGLEITDEARAAASNLLKGK